MRSSGPKLIGKSELIKMIMSQKEKDRESIDTIVKPTLDEKLSLIVSAQDDNVSSSEDESQDDGMLAMPEQKDCK